MAVQFAKAFGAESIAVGIEDETVELAVKKLGADLGINSKKEKWVERVTALGGADVILATAGSPQLMAESIGALAPDGTLVLLALEPKELQMPPSTEFIQMRRRMMGSNTGSISDAAEMLQLVARRGIRPMIEVYQLEEATKALERVRQSKTRYRAVLKT